MSKELVGIVKEVSRLMKPDEFVEVVDCAFAATHSGCGKIVRVLWDNETQDFTKR